MKEHLHFFYTELLICPSVRPHIHLMPVLPLLSQTIEDQVDLEHEAILLPLALMGWDYVSKNHGASLSSLYSDFKS